MIYAHDEASFLSRQKLILKLAPQASIHWGCSAEQTRLEVLLRLPDRWILALDCDCQPTVEVLCMISTLANKLDQQKRLIVGGVYLNPSRARYLQKVHNLIANLWVQQSYIGPNRRPYFLGGVFLINTSGLQSNENLQLFWGAEDQQLAQDLKMQGYHITINADLTVVHHTASSLQHFFRRAWLHGIHQPTFTKHPAQAIWPQYSFWIKRVLRANLTLLPAVLMHFAIQKGARLTQKVLRLHKPTPSLERQ